MLAERTCLALLVIASAACAAPPPSPFHGRTARGGADAEESAPNPGPAQKKFEAAPSSDDDDDDANEATPAATKSPEAPQASVLSVSFAAGSGAAFNGMPIARLCSHTGADLTQGTLLDATGLSIVKAASPSQVLVTVTGVAFERLKADFLKTGRLDIAVDPKLLPRSGEDMEFAIIGHGDQRFGSPSACRIANLKPTMAQRDVEEFPTNKAELFGIRKRTGPGCAILGYLEAYFAEGEQKIHARPASQFLVSSWEEPKGGFTLNRELYGCDGKDSPLVLDLGGRGVRLSPPTHPVFDVDGDGKPDVSPWIASDDTPFLVMDRNGNGIVDGVLEMFGNRTIDPNGAASSTNGFDALTRWDDGDGVIDRRDAVWTKLRLWFDDNHDGQTDPGELVMLEARGVRSIALSYLDVDERLGPLGAVRQRGAATMTDGRVTPVVDVWFYRSFAER